MRALYTFFLFNTICLCASAQSRDLSMAFKQYSAGHYFALTNNSSVDIQPEFTITNHGPEMVKKGDSVFVTVRLNDMETDMQLRDKSDPQSRIPDFIVLDADLPVGGSVSYNPSPYTPLTITSFYLSLFGFEKLDLCFRVFGVGRASYSNTYPDDTRPGNNETCVSVGSPISGISDFREQRTRINAYPNPANDRIHFSFNESDLAGAYSVSIMDMSGGTRQHEPIGYSRQSVDISGLDSGFYLYTIQNNGHVIGWGRFMIQP